MKNSITSLYDSEIRALSWKEPFCTLMLHCKDETRIWPTNYRGFVLGCASKAPYKFQVVNNEISGGHQMNRIWETMDYISYEDDLETYGKAVWLGELVDCVPMEKKDEDICFVKYREPWIDEKSGKTKRLWRHIYKNVVPIIPFDWKGKQGWSTLTRKQKEKIVYLP